MRVLIVDMQSIEPPIGGGRIRLLGLYHGLKIETRYVGTFDWPGEKYRKIQLTDSLTEIDIPLSDNHFSIAEKWKQKADGKNLIDVAFHKMVHESPEFINTVHEEFAGADLIVFSHPWVYPALRKAVIASGKPFIYDAQNVESYLRYQILGEDGFVGKVVKEVARIECQLCLEADFIFACSQEDRLLFNRLYDVSLKKIKVIPNGVFTSKIKPYCNEKKKVAKKKMKIAQDAFVAIFIGSAYGPNQEAAEFIVNKLAKMIPDIFFVIAGSVGCALKEQTLPENCTVTGHITEEEKLEWLGLSDIAVNPMFSGSGTNIKMFEFMAAGLTVVSTETGARGIPQPAQPAFKCCAAESFQSTLMTLVGNKECMLQLAKNARIHVEEKYSWERLSYELGIFFSKVIHRVKPKISVIVATYDRHEKLAKLIDKLSSQNFHKFEVIIVDQSKEKWKGRNKKTFFPLLYIHTSNRGAVKARNTGESYATGDILAFTDDDCEPDKEWLSNVVKYFDSEDVIGVEGMICSDHINDSQYRTVCNVGFEGIGFMTANLFIKHDIFNLLNGFDERFDLPHFREDTDLGWRAQQYGRIVYADDVKVFHPPHKRDKKRECRAERDTFFEKDALLFQKHPDKFIELMLAENHYQKTPGYWENVVRGAQLYGVDLENSKLWNYVPVCLKK